MDVNSSQQAKIDFSYWVGLTQRTYNLLISTEIRIVAQSYQEQTTLRTANNTFALHLPNRIWRGSCVLPNQSRQSCQHLPS
jgi:hypothetical protein